MKLEINGILIDTGNEPVTFLDSPNVNTSKIDMDDIAEIAKEFESLRSNGQGDIKSTVSKLLPVLINLVGSGKYSALIPLFTFIEEGIKNIKSNKASQKKENKLILPTNYSDPMPAETPADLSGCDLSPMRTKRVHPGNLIKAPVNIKVTSSKIKGLRWKEPDGYQVGKHGFMVVCFKGNKVISGSEEHWSRGSADSRMKEKAPGTSHVVVAWVNIEGRGDEVYGRSKLTEVR